MMSLSDLSHDELAAMHEEQSRAYEELLTKGLKLDLTRGKPSPAQLDLSNELLTLPGEWNYTEQFSIGIFEGAVTCSDTGSYQFSQSGAQIDGTKAQVGTCLGSLASSDNTSGAFAISGSLSPTHLRFSDSDCLFEADVLSPSPSTLSGTVSCGDWSGTWQAAPGGAPVATVDVRWDVQTLVGASVKLVAVPRDAAGHALSRSVSWSSDNGSVRGK